MTKQTTAIQQQANKSAHGKPFPNGPIADRNKPKVTRSVLDPAALVKAANTQSLIARKYFK